MDAQSVLWTDVDIYRRRYEKAATALVAVERVLRRERPLEGGEDEFLDLYPQLASADPNRFTEIWHDPSAYLWARRAYELLGWCLKPAPPPGYIKEYSEFLGTCEPQRALAMHLDQFKTFIVGLELTSGNTRYFRRPLAADLPLSVPGSKYSLMGRGPILINGVAAGAINAVHDGRSVRIAPGQSTAATDMVRIIERPEAALGDYRLLLRPETFYLPGIEAAEALRNLPEEFQKEQVGLIEQALRLVQRHHPMAFHHLCELVQVIALKPAASGNFSNISYSDLAGAFILSAVQEPYWIADALIHETFHNRLFFIQEIDPILADPDDESGYYSPWRDDLRPLNGLLHAIYVYVQVCRFWCAVWRSTETSGIRREYVQDQGARASLQLQIAAHELRKFGKFTAQGSELFEALENDVDAVAAEVEAAGMREDGTAMIVRSNGLIVPAEIGSNREPLSIIDTVRRHAYHYDKKSQCSDLDTILNS
jgi:HEXXH motif-containing protein